LLDGELAYQRVSFAVVRGIWGWADEYDPDKYCDRSEQYEDEPDEENAWMG
jgi:hypothetical protein